MERLFWVCLAGGFGTGARHVVSLWAARQFGTTFPYGTLLVNLVGCFAIAVVMHSGRVPRPLRRSAGACKFAGMSDLATGDWTDCGRLYGCNCGGVAVQSGELDLEGLPVRVDVNHRANVAHLKAFGRDRFGQNDAIVLLDHVEDHPLRG